MSKTRRWVIILLSLAVLVMIGINLADKDDTAQVVVNNNEPTYKSEHTDTVVHNTLNIIRNKRFRGLLNRY